MIHIYPEEATNSYVTKAVFLGPPQELAALLDKVALYWPLDKDLRNTTDRDEIRKVADTIRLHRRK